MRTTDDLTPERQAPLGAPVNRPSPEPPEGRWLPVPDSPHIERNTATGRMRNVRPEPPPAPQYPYFGISGAPPP